MKTGSTTNVWFSPNTQSILSSTHACIHVPVTCTVYPLYLNTGVEKAVVMARGVEQTFVSERHGGLLSGDGVRSRAAVEERRHWDLGQEGHEDSGA